MYDTPKLTLTTEIPIWIDQWPLAEEMLVALKRLVQEQLDKGHIISTTSHWNTPVL